MEAVAEAEATEVAEETAVRAADADDGVASSTAVTTVVKVAVERGGW